jgi:hypothetical protein
MRLTTSLLLILIFLAAFERKGWACSCAGPEGPSAAYRSAKAVFLGTAVESAPRTRKMEVSPISGKNAGQREMIEVEGYSLGKFESVTDSTGHFRFVALPPGEYEVNADLPKSYKIWARFGSQSETGADILPT